MPSPLDRKLKVALDETRLLILGVQVLLGFEFQAFFQTGFEGLSAASKYLCSAALVLTIVSLGCLVAPSMQHQLAERGETSVRLLTAASRYSGASLVPLIAAIGLSSYVVIARSYAGAALATALVIAGAAAFFWFGLPILTRTTREIVVMPEEKTQLTVKIEQMLTEARVIIPGAQALFGFQFIAMLTQGFDHLTAEAKTLHLAALVLVALNVVLLMTPAALHRIAFGGEDSERFFWMGSLLVTTAPFVLAAGLSAEMFVVLTKMWAVAVAATGALAGFAAMMVLWYVVPLALRRLRTSAPPDGVLD